METNNRINDIIQTEMDEYNKMGIRAIENNDYNTVQRQLKNIEDSAIMYSMSGILSKAIAIRSYEYHETLKYCLKEKQDIK